MEVSQSAISGAVRQPEHDWQKMPSVGGRLTANLFCNASEKDGLIIDKMRCVA
jgi:hypothetical protein